MTLATQADQIAEVVTLQARYGVGLVMHLFGYLPADLTAEIVPVEHPLAYSVPKQTFQVFGVGIVPEFR